MIISKDISLSFGDKVVFRNLNFTVYKGENICFAGPSGRGKSSLLKMLQGYLLPDTGNFEINGMMLNIENIRSIRSIMAYLPQNINLPVNDGEELLELLNAGERKEQVYSFIEELGMPAAMLGNQFSEISGGQKQRIVTAICLSLDREIVLLDEPASSLDKDSIIKLINVIHNLENKTIVSASHNPEWIKSVNKTILL